MRKIRIMITKRIKSRIRSRSKMQSRIEGSGDRI
jgi:hypothetical protein